ncbi:class I SAM-dependent methyltransferase [Shimia sp.]|uniref:class I SAM-dependent methyltransferase n=1 Tax=Shimia sp. TaxID=1954381 RepID=UPI003296DC3E
MSDKETLDAYAKAARAYADGFAKPEDTFHDPDFEAFVALLPPGGHVLDLGCGPGQWAARMVERGLVVTATDASPEMAALALQDFGIPVKVAPFDALTDKGVFDGVWANFSLLHAPRADFPAHLQRVHQALKPGGAFHIGMKLGASEGRDYLGRFYAYYGERELCDLLVQAGFTIKGTRRGNGKGLAGGVETFVIITAHA